MHHTPLGDVAPHAPEVSEMYRVLDITVSGVRYTCYDIKLNIQFSVYMICLQYHMSPLCISAYGLWCIHTVQYHTVTSRPVILRGRGARSSPYHFPNVYPAIFSVFSKYDDLIPFLLDIHQISYLVLGLPYLYYKYINPKKMIKSDTSKTNVSCRRRGTYTAANV